MSVTKITADTFEKEVVESTLPVLIDFWASWCGPCRMLSPIVDEIADDYPETLKVVKANVDEENALAAQFNIRNIPTLVYIRDKKIEKVIEGYRGKSELISLLGL